MLDKDDVAEIARWLKTPSNKVYVSKNCKIRAGTIKEERTNRLPFPHNLNAGALVVVAKEVEKETPKVKIRYFDCEYLFITSESDIINRSMFFMPKISMEVI